MSASINSSIHLDFLILIGIDSELIGSFHLMIAFFCKYISKYSGLKVILQGAQFIRSTSQMVFSISDPNIIKKAGSVVFPPGPSALCAPEKPDLTFIRRTELPQPPVRSIIAALLADSACCGHAHGTLFQNRDLAFLSFGL